MNPLWRGIWPLEDRRNQLAEIVGIILVSGQVCLMRGSIFFVGFPGGTRGYSHSHPIGGNNGPRGYHSARGHNRAVFHHRAVQDERADSDQDMVPDRTSVEDGPVPDNDVAPHREREPPPGDV